MRRRSCLAVVVSLLLAVAGCSTASDVTTESAAPIIETEGPTTSTPATASTVGSVPKARSRPVYDVVPPAVVRPKPSGASHDTDRNGMRNNNSASA
jgi:hypothetical protein